MILLFDLEFRDPATGALVTYRVGTHPLTTGPGDDPPNAYYEPVILQPFERSWFLWSPGSPPPGAQPRTEISKLVCSTASDSPEYDFAAVRAHDLRSVTVRAGRPGEPYSAFQPLAVLEGQGLKFSKDRVEVRLRDSSYRLAVPLQRRRYLGLGQCLEFKGAEGQRLKIVDAPSLNPTTAVTVYAQIYLQAKTDGAGIITKGGSAPDHQYLLRQAAGGVSFTVKTDQGEATAQSAALDLERWYEVAGTFGPSGSVRCLVRPLEPGATYYEVSTPLAGTIHTGTDPVRVNRYSGLSGDLRIDEVRIYDRELTIAKLRDVAPSPAEGDDAGLVCYLRLDEGDGTMAFDETSHANNAELIRPPSWVSRWDGYPEEKGDWVPAAFGRPLNVPLEEVDGYLDHGAYQASGGPIRGVLEVYDDRSPLHGEGAEPTGYREELALGGIVLLNPPHGQLTADIEGDIEGDASGGAFHETAGAVARHLVSGFSGILDDPDEIDTAAYEALEAERPWGVGFHAGTRRPVRLVDVERTLLASVGAVPLFGPDGRRTAVRILPPEDVAPVAVYVTGTDDDADGRVLSLEELEPSPPLTAVTVQFKPNWTVQKRSELAGAFAGDARFTERAFREVVVELPEVAEAYRGAGPGAPVRTFLGRRKHARELAAELARLRGVPRRAFKVTLPADVALERRLGEVVELRAPEVDVRSSRFLVFGLKIRDLEEVTLWLWGGLIDG